MKYTIWAAHNNELSIVMDLLCERVNWLRDQGSDQWSTYERWEPEMVQSIRAGRTFILRDSDTTPVGTITTSLTGDADFWTKDELATPALYLAKLATRTDRAGRGLGDLMIDFAMFTARTKRLHELRIDVWRTAENLHRYYSDRGWNYLRTVEKPERFSGTLFSKPVEIPLVNTPPSDLEVRPIGSGTGYVLEADRKQSSVATFI